MKNIIPEFTEPTINIPNQESTANIASKPVTIDAGILAFLQDIQQHPDSGIARRYKRLEISVRQGQKLKETAIVRGLIEEHIETTKTGRIKVVRITRKGQTIISQKGL